MRTFSFGGGVQSMAVLVLAVQGKLQYDHFLFSNVGLDSEYPGTLEYFETVALPYAANNGILMHEIFKTRRVVVTNADGSIRMKKNARGKLVIDYDYVPETLMGRLTKVGSKSIPIPVRMSNGAPGTRNCTADFKIGVIAKWLKQHGATPENPAITGLGISLDEWDRVRTDSGIEYQVLESPLIDMRITRNDCIKIIQESGLPVPPKSSCYFCPFHSKNFWIEQRRNEPELFKKSVNLEIALNRRRVMLGKDAIYFHSSLRPLSQAVGDQPSLFDEHVDACIGVSCMT